ncbi:MAG: hypothetical protein HY925_04320 [Elusimicrobia bacterium]|nr:hypothetical protein [Elusimicrobiota bacterium]
MNLLILTLLAGLASALSGSKLGPHVLGDANDASARLLQDACPRVAKWLARSGEGAAVRRYREKCPGGQIVIRVYVPQSVHYGLSMRPEQAAEDFWARISPELSELPPSLVDWLEGVNELDNVEDWYHNGEASLWFAAFSSRLADLIHAAGYDPLLGSIAVGNPSLEGEQLFGKGGAMAPLAAVIRSKPYKVGWSYHAYGDNLFSADDAKYWTLRYRMIRDQAGLQGVPLVLTEGGQDGGRGGWIGRTSPEDFMKWLGWLDSELKKDREVEGVTLFQVGQHADWKKFDLGPIAERLAEHIKGDKSVPAPAAQALPPVPPPAPKAAPQPVAAAVLRAAAGQSFGEQDEETQAQFIAYWTPRGIDPEKRWVEEHNLDLTHPGWRDR